MIKDAILKFLVEHEEKSDGGLESLLKIIKHYKSNTATINLNNLIQEIYPISTIVAIVKTASKSGFISVICDKVDIPTIINYNQPIIISTTTAEKKIHFVVCYSYNKDKGFLIWDSRNGSYYTSIEGLILLRADQKCIAFCPN